MIKLIIILLSIGLVATLMIICGIIVLVKGLFFSSESDDTTFPLPRFLERRIITDEAGFKNCATAFCKAACEGDCSALQSLFSSNVISQIGEDELRQMLLQLIAYWEGDFVKLQDKLSVYTSSAEQHDSQRSLMMEGPIDVFTTEGEYRLVLNYVSYDEFDKGNEGIGAIVLVKKEDDAKIEYPNYITSDKQYIPKDNTNGIYIGP